jgi:hypothetical protein
MEVLRATFSGRWIGTGGSILWSPRGLNLTPIDFLFCDHVRNCVYMDKIRDPNHLKAKIREVAEQVTGDMLQRLWKEVEYRLDICMCLCGNLIITFSTI